MKVRIGSLASGKLGLKQLEVALRIVADLGLPVMCHVDHPHPEWRGS